MIKLGKVDTGVSATDIDGICAYHARAGNCPLQRTAEQRPRQKKCHHGPIRAWPKCREYKRSLSFLAKLRQRRLSAPDENKFDDLAGVLLQGPAFQFPGSIVWLFTEQQGWGQLQNTLHAAGKFRSDDFSSYRRAGTGHEQECKEGTRHVKDGQRVRYTRTYWQHTGRN